MAASANGHHSNMMNGFSGTGLHSTNAPNFSNNSASSPPNSLQLGGRLGSMTLPRQMSRQLSIYSLTLDEFQTTLGEPGKNFGSMNMDELLKNIWTAEESQAMAALFNNNPAGESSNANAANNPANNPSGTNNLPRQPSLNIQRQNSLTLLPLPQSLSKKTVDEVWRDIGDFSPGNPISDHQNHQNQQNQQNHAQNHAQQAIKHHRQGTYGEMTLEDFLIKAGVMVPEVEPAAVVPSYYAGTAGGTSGAAGGTAPYSGMINGMNVSINGNGMMEQKPHGGIQPILGGMTGLLPGKKEPIELNEHPIGLGIGLGGSASTISPGSNGYVTFSNGNTNNTNNGNNSASIASTSAAQTAAKQQAEWMESQYKNSTALAQQQQQQLMQLAMMNNGNVGIGLGPIVPKDSSPGSPMSDAQGYGLSSGGNFGLDGPLRGRKRILDAPLEKIVERRQRRMIKNRESAARSRARKQAYTVELEAEVTQLKEENMRLRKMQEEENVKRKKQQVLEVIAPMTRHLPKMLRRTVTGPW